MKKNINIFIVLILLFFLPAKIFSEENYYYFRPEINYGSDFMFNPLNLFINGSYDIFRNGSHSKHLINQPYKQGFENVMKNITSPKKNIKAYGIKNFFKREIGNFDGDVRESQFLPNIGLHVLGNGMQYVKLSEWFDYHKYPFPRILSASTTIAYQMMNEILENGEYSGPNVDPISDMLIFNPIGFTLFSIPAVNRFFSTKMPIYDWSPQPIVTIHDINIHNAGQQYATKIKLLLRSNYSFFINWGVSSVVGLSKKYSDQSSISLGFGAIVNLLKEKKSKSDNSRYMLPGLDYALGIYYDKNNSLMTSILLSGPKYYNLRMNVYPGVIKYKNIQPGIFAAIGELDNFQIGISIPNIPIGLGI